MIDTDTTRNSLAEQPLHASLQNPHHEADDGLIMLPADSTAQSYFAGEPAVLRKFVKAPRQIRSQWSFFQCPDSLTTAQCRRTWSPTVRKWVETQSPSSKDFSGTLGIPVRYQMRADDVVTTTLLFSFILVIWVIAGSWHFLRRSIKNFFYHRTRHNLFTDRINTVLRGHFFLVAQSCFMHGILFLVFVRKVYPEALEQLSPYTILGGATLIIGLFYLFKLALYIAINNTFFTSDRRQLWIDNVFISILTIGVLLLPLSLLLVFFDLPFEQGVFIYILLIAIVKSLLIYKCYHIFFHGVLGGVQLILYFCALEITPIVFLWGSLMALLRQLGLPL